MAISFAGAAAPALRLQVSDRRIVAAAAVAMQAALGAVYAWSVFRTPLAPSGWSISQVTLTFTITILTLGFAAFPGGLWMAAAGPRVVGIAAGVLYGLGVFLAGFAGDRLWALCLTYGLLGGAALGWATSCRSRRWPSGSPTAAAC